MLKGEYKNDFLGLEFEPLFPGEPKLTGEEVINKVFRVKVLAHSKWWDLAAVAAILMCYRLLFFVVLIKAIQERAGPALKAIQAKRNMRSLDKRPSFKRMPSLSVSLSMSSRRHLPLRSLSCYEGLNSPAHYKRTYIMYN
uniref:Uncharacterized protein n=1 Tax=Brassica oleracea var. oleracea TaxID=109376 RepID=A0A0D3ABW9_BRAOL